MVFILRYAISCPLATVVDRYPSLEITPCLGDWITGNGIDQADPECFGGTHLFSRNQKLQRSAFANQARKPLCSSPTCNQTEGSAAMAKDRIGSGDSSMARKGEVKSSAHAMAFDSRDDGSRIACDQVHERLSEAREFVSFGTGKRSNLVEVCADGEVVKASDE